MQFQSIRSRSQSNLIQDKPIFSTEYEKISVLGKGNFASVYLCRNLIDKQLYAIKHTKSRPQTIIEYSEARTEAINLGKLFQSADHPNIVRYYRSWVEQKEIYLVMEYCDYNLRHQKQYQEFEIKCILRDVLQGLQYMHSNGMAHVDIKPENILFQKRKVTYKLGDYGLSRGSYAQENEDINEGDARYMAPEIIQHVNEGIRMELSKADIFSLGCTLYELMIQRALQNGDDEWDKLRQGITESYLRNQLNNQYSNQLIKFVVSMLNPNPYYRPSAQNLLDNPFISVSDRKYLEYLKRINKIVIPIKRNIRKQKRNTINFPLYQKKEEEEEQQQENSEQIFL